MNRVDSARLAVMRAREVGLETRGSVCASDAFFPFRDGLDVVAKAGADRGDPSGGLAPGRGSRGRGRPARHGHGGVPGSAISSTSLAPERVFSLRELTRLLRLSPKRRSQLRRLGLLRDDPRGVRFRELVSARAAAQLLESGASVRQVRAALDGARRLVPASSSARRAAAHRPRRVAIVVEQDRLRLDPGTGQALLDFAAGELEREDARGAAAGLVRPLIPPADAAEGGSSAPRSGTPTRAVGPRRWTPTSACTTWLRTTGRPGTTWGSCITAWGSTRSAAALRGGARRGSDAAPRPAYNLGSLHDDLGDVPVATPLVPPRARDPARLRRRSLQPGRRARAGRGTERDARRPLARATSSSTPTAAGPRSPAPAWTARPSGPTTRRRRATNETCSWSEAAGASTRSPGSSRRARALGRAVRRARQPRHRRRSPRSVAGDAGDIDGCLSPRTSAERIDLVVVGPEAPLALGLADRSGRTGFAVFGPHAPRRALESCKAFAKDLMRRPRHPHRALRAPSRDAGGGAGALPARGRAAGGEGRRARGRQGRGGLPRRVEEADAGGRAMLRRARASATPARTVLIEEFLVGRGGVASSRSADGDTRAPARRRRRTTSGSLDGDRGPNTGGMGAYSPAPVIDAGAAASA